MAGVGPGMLGLQDLYQGWVSVFPEDPDAGQEMLAWPCLGPCALLSPVPSPFPVASLPFQTLSLAPQGQPCTHQGGEGMAGGLAGG